MAVGGHQLLREAAPPELWWVAALALYTGQRQGDVLQMKLSDCVKARCLSPRKRPA